MFNSVTGNCERIFITTSSISCFTLMNDDSLLLVGDENGYLRVFGILNSVLLIREQLFDCVRNLNS